MSDPDGDLSDELLELAGATEKKRKRRHGEGSSMSESKRWKAEYVVPRLLYPVPIASAFPT
jgi:RNA polymerase-associated protein RTF1